MQIRTLNEGDLERALELYAEARQRMKQSGNPNQWKDSHPPRRLIEEDIARGTGYAVVENGQIVGVFAFLLGEDPTYAKIEGKWLSDGPYGTVHRVAGDRAHRGILQACLSYCEAQAESVRIDTHAENAIMRHLLTKFGYTECGVIYVADGSPRVAYQKVIKR